MFGTERVKNNYKKYYFPTVRHDYEVGTRRSLQLLTRLRLSFTILNDDLGRRINIIDTRLCPCKTGNKHTPTAFWIVPFF
jgi:hypothetical protein